jgi:hypothetical protein
LWNTIYGRILLSSKAYEAPDDEFTDAIRKAWNGFMRDDLPLIRELIVDALTAEILDPIPDSEPRVE